MQVHALFVNVARAYKTDDCWISLVIINMKTQLIQKC